jgi:uncharacterized membrane protein
MHYYKHLIYPHWFFIYYEFRKAVRWVPTKKSSSKNNDTESALCYIPFLGFLPAVVFLIIEKDKRIRFNAIQSLLTFAVWFGLSRVPFTGGIWFLLFFVFWLIMAVKVNKGEEVKLPLLGEWAEQLNKKV